MANKLNDRMRSIFANTRSRVIFVVVAVIVLGGIAGGAYLIYDSINYYSTDNAYISAPLIPVVAYGQTQIISLDATYGAYVEKGERLATVGQPRPSNLTDVLGANDVPMGRGVIESPVSGYVAAIWQYQGAVIPAGSQIVTIYDASDIWIIANVTEAQLYRIQPGQDVEISVDALNGTKLKGTVIGIGGVTAATFSLLPQNNTSGNFVKVAQVIPVKISVENPANYILIPGSSVEVRIATR